MKIITKLSPLFILALLCLVACDKEVPPPTNEVSLELPEVPYNYADQEMPQGLQFQLVDNTPDDNIMSDHGATLGRVLFYDTKLSLNNVVSCASCHHQSKAFADPDRFSSGFDNRKTSRNSPAIANLRFARHFFWDAEATILEEQVLMPIKDHLEMGMESLEDLEAKLKLVDYYPALFEKAFGSPEITSDRISKSMAQFIRSMSSFNSKFDKGQANDFSNFTPLELAGKDLFFSWGSSCSSCHGGDAFTSGENANIGLDLVYSDNGVGALSGNDRDNGMFKIPSLRNIALTAPYMHDGRYQTLEEVIEHYSSNVQSHPNLDWRLNQSMNFTDSEKQALLAFLHTLTDEEYISDPKFSNPFK